MNSPHRAPTGLQLNQTAKAVAQAFDEELARAGGSLPIWLVLLNLKSRRPTTQRALAAAVGIQEATLSHHLSAMDAAGLITRRRDDLNRRVQIVELSAAGEAAFVRLRNAARTFDRRLTRGLSAEEKATFSELLDRLASNASVGQ